MKDHVTRSRLAVARRCF